MNDVQIKAVPIKGFICEAKGTPSFLAIDHLERWVLICPAKGIEKYFPSGYPLPTIRAMNDFLRDLD